MEQRALITEHLRSQLVSRRAIFLLEAKTTTTEDHFYTGRETACVFPSLGSVLLDGTIVEALLARHALRIQEEPIEDAVIEGTFVPEKDEPLVYM